MRDASTEIFEAVRSALMADPTIAGLVGDRISTDWALVLAPPFIRLQLPSVSSFKPDGAGPGSEYALHVHIYTKERGGIVRGQIVDRVLAILDENPLPLATSSMWWLLHKGTIPRTDAVDPALQTARLEFNATTTDGN